MINNQYWEKRWEANDIVWHEPDVHPLLVKFVNVLGLNKRKVIFVPFCGASIDILYLVRLGYQVIGSEISSIACKKFFVDHELDFKIEKCFSYSVYKSDNILIYCGDYFHLEKRFFHEVDAVYDRAALIALPQKLRNDYVTQLRRLIPNTLNILLITITYDNLRDTPPYNVCEDELSFLYGDEFEIIKLGQFNQTQVCIHLCERNFMNPVEHVFHIKQI